MGHSRMILPNLVLEVGSMKRHFQESMFDPFFFIETVHHWVSFYMAKKAYVSSLIKRSALAWCSLSSQLSAFLCLQQCSPSVIQSRAAFPQHQLGLRVGASLSPRMQKSPQRRRWERALALVHKHSASRAHWMTIPTPKNAGDHKGRASESKSRNPQRGNTGI